MAKIPKVPCGRPTTFGRLAPIVYFCRALVPAKAELTDGVTGNTSDFGSEESRFEPWSVNRKAPRMRGFLLTDLSVCAKRIRMALQAPGARSMPHAAWRRCGKPWSVNRKSPRMRVFLVRIVTEGREWTLPSVSRSPPFDQATLGSCLISSLKHAWISGSAAWKTTGCS